MKKIYSLWMMLFPLAVAAVSCGKEPVDTAASLSVKPISLEFAATGNDSQIVAVTATNTEWTHEVSGAAQEWLSASLGEDGKSLLISVTDNTTAEKRSGTVSVKAVDHIEIKPIGITVQQEAGEGTQPGGSITVNPESLTFAGEGAEAQRVAVTVSNPELTWTAAAEDAVKDWITVTVDGDGISVSVSDNPETDQRSGNIIITPGLDDVRPRAVRVVQEGRVLPPSLDVDRYELSFPYYSSTDQVLSVTAVNCDWAVRIEYPEGSEGGWLRATAQKEIHSVVSVAAGPNDLLEPRTASIVVYALGGIDVPEVTVAVTQEAGKEFLSTLEGPAEITDLSPLGGFFYQIFPSQLWDLEDPGTYWDIELWSAGVTKSEDISGNVSYGGNGTRMVIRLFSERIPFNDDQEFSIPAGDYAVKAYDAVVQREDITSYTVATGLETRNLVYPSGSWYMRVENGEFVEAGPIMEGSMNVAVTPEGIYTFVFDFKDDQGYSITGTGTGAVTEARCSYFEEQPDSGVVPDPDPDPTPDTDPGFGQ